MKRIIIIILIIFFIYFFEYLISVNSKLNNLILKNKTKGIRYLTIQSLVDNETIELDEFSGEYKELSSIEIENNNKNNKYLIEDIYFLLTTNPERIRFTINFIKFWSKSKNINCIIVFEEKDFNRRKSIQYFLKNEEIECQIEISNVTRYEERFFYLIKFGSDYIKNKNKTFSWFAIGDDDTIWFINNLLKTLQQYNSSKFIYLGNISDRKYSIEAHGKYFAYGGGGILLTKPLVLLISKYYQQCQQFYYMSGGDEIIGKCITKLFKFNLTINKHFHQIDHEGDIYGFLQSGIEGLVTLHHMFTYWEPFPEEHSQHEKDIIQIIEIAYQTFNFEFLKRFFKINFKKNETLLLTNGYSFTLFNRILTEEELNNVELTWCCSELYQQKTRPIENNKINWFFKKLTTEYFNGQIINGSIYQYQKKQIKIIFNN